jgi:hypothetical protein
LCVRENALEHVLTLRPFLAKKRLSAEDVGKMHAAWVKSCLL